MKGLRTVVMAGVALGVAVVMAPRALADDSGWYARADVSFVALSNGDWSASSGPVTTSYDNGWGADLAVGRSLGTVWSGGAIRGEFELSWKYSGVKDLSQGGMSLNRPNGHTRMMALTYNLIDDFRPNATIDPYLGLGAGYSDLRYYQWGGPAGVDSTGSAFAYQALAGLKFNLGSSLDLDLGYSWFATSNASVTTYGGTKTDVSYRANTVSIGADWSF